MSHMYPNFDYLWNNSFPGGERQEQGGTIVAESDGTLKVVNMKAGTSGNFDADLNVRGDQSIMGIVHTHPGRASFSGGDARWMMYWKHRIMLVNTGDEQYMLMRTSATPSRADASLNDTQNNRMFELMNSGMSRIEASKQAIKETAWQYNLAYYEGTGGTFYRVYP